MVPSFLDIEGEDQPLPATGPWALLVLTLALAVLALCIKPVCVKCALRDTKPPSR